MREDDASTSPPAGPGAFDLLVFIRPEGRPPPPPAAEEAERHFAEARRRYKAGDYQAAAEQFLAAAAPLLPPLDDRFTELFAADRLAAYQNAGWSWLMAGRPDRAAGLATDDPECAPAMAEWEATFLRTR